MRISLVATLRALVCIFAPLALPLPGLADESNAAKVDAATWVYMNQVMSGTSTKSPDQLAAPLKIRTPQGLYVYIDAHFLYDVVAPGVSGVSQDDAFKNYLNFMLSQPGVAGLLFSAPWSMLANPTGPGGPYQWQPLDDAFEAVSAAGKTLQVGISPGANSPPWLFQSPYLTSCDFLFDPAMAMPTNHADCGYTAIFDISEGDSTAPLLPLPWNSTYKTQWKDFLKALNSHIKTKKWDNYFVSIGIAGPTMLSAEMFLPKKLVSPLPAGYYTPTGPGPSTPGSPGNAAWNCLFANYYGAAPASGAYYLNSDRAFIEEWAAAIDMYGDIFSGITLVVNTGNALPDFANESAGTVTCNSGLTISAAAPGGSSTPLWAFLPDCGSSPLFPMDCEAEAAILAYFAEPPVGGPNAKATQEDALSASDDVVNTLLTLSNASVKWLSQITAGGLAAVPGPITEPGAAPVMSRMLGGLQFSTFAFDKKNPIKSATREGCPYLECAAPPSTIAAYCAPPPMSTGCTLLSLDAPVEQALLNALHVYFAGTFAGSGPSFRNIFGAPSTIMNNGTTVTNAPLNYLQIWSEDFEYAAGWGNCDRALIMANTLSDLTSNPKAICSTYTSPSTMPTVLLPVGGGFFLKTTAQGLLQFAGEHIPTTPVVLPLFGYNSPSMNTVCGCQAGYVQRGAFKGDDVCVPAPPAPDQSAALTENEKKVYVPNFAQNESKDNIPYGPCLLGLLWRQAYMGDYVCVTASQFTQIAADNLAGKSHSTCP